MYTAPSKGAWIPMMNWDQYVRYMKDAPRRTARTFSLTKIFTQKQQFAITNKITTDWQDAVLRDGLQRSLQGGLTGSTTDNRFALSGNYFDQKGVIPGQGYSRGAGYASIEHQAKRLRVGLSANA
jgi:hypothetical protein